MQKLVIEARVNEYAMRADNPNVPFLPGEIARDAAACRAAGAAILHFHGRDADGAPDHRYETYRDTILATRALSDILIHPTLGYVTLDATAAQRIATVARLAEDPSTRPEFAPMDVSSTNVDWYDPQARAYRTKGLIYRNGTDTLEHFASVIRAGRMAPYLVSWNIGSTRQIITFLDMGWIAAPAYVCFCLTGDLVPAGHPGTAAGLDAHLAFLPRHHAVEWTACHYNGDLLGLTEKIIAAGGHVSIGLGDHPYLERGLPTNADLIHIVAEQARALGREIATPAEARIILGVPAAASAPVHA